jgi:hypothetical protein
LGRFVRRVFRARTVEITFLGYIGETIVGALCHHMEEPLDDPGPTRRVCVRVLVPDFGQPMIVPSRVGPNGEPLDAPAVRRHRERMCQRYDHALSASAERLNGLGRVTVASEFRLYPGIPRDKICIINAQRVLVAVARIHVLPGASRCPSHRRYRRAAATLAAQISVRLRLGAGRGRCSGGSGARSRNAPSSHCCA